MNIIGTIDAEIKALQARKAAIQKACSHPDTTFIDYKDKGDTSINSREPIYVRGHTCNLCGHKWSTAQSGPDIRLTASLKSVAQSLAARPSDFGNPFVVGEPVDKRQAIKLGWWPLANPMFVAESNEEAVKRFAACLAKDQAIHNHIIMTLRGKNIACWCKQGHPCHGDVLLKLANPKCDEVK